MQSLNDQNKAILDTIEAQFANIDKMLFNSGLNDEQIAALVKTRDGIKSAISESNETKVSEIINNLNNFI